LKKLLIAFVVLISISANGQDLIFAREVVDTLTSPYFWGRGYTRDGMSKAAQYLSEQFKSYGVMPMDGKTYLQPFSFAVNTFPAKMELKLNDKAMVPGVDFLVGPGSRSYRGKANLVQSDSSNFVDAANRVVVSVTDKLTWSVASETDDYTTILLDKKALTQQPVSLEIDVESKLEKRFKAANVCGVVKGTVKPDSFLVFTAHYDHLGGMGAATFFPGANDNASGISLLLGLAKHYAENPAPYSVAFICFAAEEAGLIGSKYFTENALIPLKKIRFLTNVDLVGTGIEGITVVNATEYGQEYKWLNEINDRENYVSKINARGKAANSDHYFFSEKGVPAFFVYTLGGIKAYHDVYDVSSTLPLNEYEDLFKLIVAFNKKLTGK
jgi:hypothetical protein